MTSGTLCLKQNSGGWRHYIELPDGSHDDINCGSMLEVQLGKYVSSGNSDFVPGEWILGRYEADLCSDNPKAMLILGEFYGRHGHLTCRLPLGVRVRRVKEE